MKSKNSYTVDLSDQWYESLKQCCGSFTSTQIALWLVEAGLTKSTTTLPAVAAHVRAAMSPDKPDYFKASELIVIMRRSGSLAPVNFILAQLGCAAAVRESISSETLVRLSNHRKSLESELVMVTQKLSALNDEDHACDVPMQLFSQ